MLMIEPAVRRCTPGTIIPDQQKAAQSCGQSQVSLEQASLTAGRGDQLA